MPSSIWSGSVGFGLVQVPVRLVTATRSRDVSFNQLEEGTGCAHPLQEGVGRRPAKRSPADRIQKGYEISKGQLRRRRGRGARVAPPKASHTIDIEEFVDLAEIDPIYFEQPYYLVPDEKGKKAYRLLVDAMSELNKVAIGRIVIRAKERLVAIRPLDGLLCVETMRYSDEVVPADASRTRGHRGRPSARSRWPASSSSRSRSTSSSPRSSATSTASRCSTWSSARPPARRSLPQPEAEAPAKVLDLVAALEASLEKAAGARDRHPSQAGLEVADGETSNARPSATKATKATKPRRRQPRRRPRRPRPAPSVRPKRPALRRRANRPAAQARTWASTRS